MIGKMPRFIPGSALLLGLLFLVPPTTLACMGIKNPDYSRVPEYCRLRCDKENHRPGDDVKSMRYEKVLGMGKMGFGHLHHFCAHLMYMQMAKAEQSKPTRAFYFNNARTNIDYVLQHWTPEAVLLREAHVRKGLMLEETGHAVEALPLYQKAIQIDPKYVPAYAAYGDLLVKLGEKAQAREVLENGLSKVPQSKLLKSRLRKLGK